MACCDGSSGIFVINGKVHNPDCEEVKKYWENELEKLTNKVYRVCECGAAKTSNPNLHATYCPQYKRY